MGFKYFIGIDFECTCFMNNQSDTHKIIDFGAVLIDANTGNTIAQFHEFVDPKVTLTKECSDKTGVTNDDIRQARYFHEVLQHFKTWLDRNNCNPETNKNCAFVTWSENDFKNYLPNNCDASNIPFPSYARQWIDLMKYFGKGVTLEQAVRNKGLDFSGTAHQAISDALNTAKLAWKLNRSQNLQINSSY